MTIEEIIIPIPETVVVVRNCQHCPHHHCYHDSDGYQDCSCALGGKTQTLGIPESCPMRKEDATQ